MAVTKAALGTLNTLEDCKRALRDLEMFFNQLVVDDAPVTDGQVLVRDPEGNLRQYTIQNGAGCTVTIDDGARTITVTVP